MTSTSRSPVLKMLDFMEVVIRQKSGAKENTKVLGSYAMAGILWTVIWHVFSDRDFSAVLTLASGINGLGFFLLLQKMKATQSAAGISSKSLQMYAFVFVFRLTSTCFNEGYLPIDRSGDHAYQVLDFCSLFLVCQLLYTIHKPFATSYQSDLDSMPIYRVAMLSVLLAIGFHGNMNNRPLFDIAWHISLNLDTIAMLPQLWLLVKQGGEVEALTSHYVFSVFVSRMFCLAFWIYGIGPLAPKDGGLNVHGYFIWGSYAMQILLSADFVYHYVTWAAGKNKGGLMMPTTTEI